MTGKPALPPPGARNRRLERNGLSVTKNFQESFLLFLLVSAGDVGKERFAKHGFTIEALESVINVDHFPGAINGQNQLRGILHQRPPASF